MNDNTTRVEHLTDDSGEVRELTAADIAGFRPIGDVLPALAHIIQKRGKQKAPTKERITIRLSSEVVEYFRESGDGWQSRLDEALKGYIAGHRKAA
ncbi:BrnA antitoxin family protein [Thiothrix fructosivorans]|uniref:BrnA antitoxin family protein n=1 Tax=Thiothrix fructosivorans TaxID=111770 RepID=A0A8B0SQ90_9GAMM|nr:BrnA antitoxin family protein [Thiothrix fructosivorans]MBO0612674.1 BrnA antitoxin family protein [Thiothrix fructosivorans]QTX11857.1 BrnA antitoxin family protein [Thiothrix fructosivorans]